MNGSKIWRRDPSWVKARIAARILMRQESSSLFPRDRRLAQRLSADPGVSNRLIDQALACLCAEKHLPLEHYHVILRSALAT